MAHHEEASNQFFKPQAKKDARFPGPHEHARRTPDAQTTSAKGPLGAYSAIKSEAFSPGRRDPARKPLKRNEVFRDVYRRGIWVRAASFSLGVIRTERTDTRIGIRFRRGIKGAVVRNRLKRQLRAVLFSKEARLKPGWDVVVLVHPKTMPIPAREIVSDLLELCRHARLHRLPN